MYHKALCYCLGISVDTRRNINSIYDFKTGCVKTECLHEGWQTSGSMKVVRMAFNLYCNGTPSVDDYTKTEEQTNITELTLNDFIEKVVIHEAEGGRTKKTVLSKWIFISISLEILFFHSVRMKWKPCSQRKHAERKRLLKERENLLRNLRRKEIRSVQRSRQKHKPEIRKHRANFAERKQYQVRATVKSYRKMRDDALSGDPIAKSKI